MTALNRNSKADTVLLVDISVSAITVDIGQLRTNLTNNTTYVSEATSARTAIAGDREVSVLVDISDADRGILVFHGHAAGAPYTYLVEINIPGEVNVSEGGTLISTVTAPGVAAIASAYLVHWSTKLIGATVQSELLVTRVATGASVFASSRYSPATPNAAYGLHIGADPTGASAYPLAAIRAVRIGTRFHSTTEGREDWVTESSAPSVASETRLEVTPVDASTAIAAEGAVYGPAILHAAHAALQADKRLWSPLVSEVYRQLEPLAPTPPVAVSIAPVIMADFAPVRHAILAPGSSYMTILLRHLWQRPVPPGCTRAHARAHITVWPSGGVTVVSVQLQAWAWNRNPWSAGGIQVPDVKQASGSIVTRNVDDVTWDGAGAWVDLGNLTIPTWLGFSWLAIAVGFHGDGIDVAGTTQVRVNAVQIEPTAPTPVAGAEDYAG